MAEWQPGAFLELAQFPDYVEGRPKIDNITVRFLNDPNTLFANIVGGEVDVALPDGLSVEMAKELQGTWAAPGTGNNVLLYFDGRVFRLYFQHRPEYAKPTAARDPRVRRALYHTLDKDGINEVELAGLGRPADSWISPDNARVPLFKDAIPPWSHDISLAQRSLEEAGWQRGPDGIMVNRATGERLETEIRVTPGQGHTKALAVMADGWRQAGAAVTRDGHPCEPPHEWRVSGDPAVRGAVRPYDRAPVGEPAVRLQSGFGSEQPLDGGPRGLLQPRRAAAHRSAPGDDSGRGTDPHAGGHHADRSEGRIRGAPALLAGHAACLREGHHRPQQPQPGRYGNAWSPWNVHLWDKQ